MKDSDEPTVVRFPREVPPITEREIELEMKGYDAHVRRQRASSDLDAFIAARRLAGIAAACDPIGPQWTPRAVALEPGPARYYDELIRSTLPPLLSEEFAALMAGTVAPEILGLMQAELIRALEFHRGRVAVAVDLLRIMDAIDLRAAAEDAFVHVRHLRACLRTVTAALKQPTNSPAA